MLNNEPTCYEVIVGNIGSVYCGNVASTAVEIFEYYKQNGLDCTRADGSVTLFVNAELEKEHTFPVPGE